MKIQEALNSACAAVRNVKETQVRQCYKSGRTDINTFIQAYRGDETVALVSLPPHRDRMLEAAWFAASGFSADVIAVSHDSWGVVGEHAQANPITGKPWVSGDMAELVAEHDAIAKGWIHETILTMVLNRAGDEADARLPYRIAGRDVEWLPDEVPEEGLGRQEGIVADALRDAMSNQTMNSLLGSVGFTPAMIGLDDERALAHQDVAATIVLEKKLEEAGAPWVQVVLAANPGSVREQIIRRRFPRSKVVRPG